MDCLTLSQPHCLSSSDTGVYLPLLVMSLQALFCKTCNALKGCSSAPPQRLIWNINLLMKIPLPSMSLVLKLAMLDIILNALSLVVSCFTRLLSLFWIYSPHLRSSWIKIPRSFSDLIGLIFSCAVSILAVMLTSLLFCFVVIISR